MCTEWLWKGKNEERVRHRRDTDGHRMAAAGQVYSQTQNCQGRKETVQYNPSVRAGPPGNVSRRVWKSPGRETPGPPWAAAPGLCHPQWTEAPPQAEVKLCVLVCGHSSRPVAGQNEQSRAERAEPGTGGARPHPRQRRAACGAAAQRDGPWRSRGRPPAPTLTGRAGRGPGSGW